MGLFQKNIFFSYQRSAHSRQLKQKGFMLMA